MGIRPWACSSCNVAENGGKSSMVNLSPSLRNPTFAGSDLPLRVIMTFSWLFSVFNGLFVYWTYKQTIDILAWSKKKKKGNKKVPIKQSGWCGAVGLFKPGSPGAVHSRVVKRFGWKWATPNLKQYSSFEKGEVPSLGRGMGSYSKWRSLGISGSCSCVKGHGAGDRQADRCIVGCDVDFVSGWRGDEGAEPKFEPLN